MSLPLAHLFLPLELATEMPSLDYGAFFQILRKSLSSGRLLRVCLPHLLQIPHIAMARHTHRFPAHQCKRCEVPLGSSEYHVNKQEWSALVKAGGVKPHRILIIVGSVQDLIATPIAKRGFGTSQVVRDITVKMQTCFHPELVPIERTFSFIKVETVKEADYEWLLRCKMAECPGIPLSESILLLTRGVDLSLVASVLSHRGMVQFGLSWGAQDVKLEDVESNPIATWTDTDSKTSRLTLPREGSVPYITDARSETDPADRGSQDRQRDNLLN